MKGTFEEALQGRQVSVLSAYGHTHEQECEGWADNGQCNVLRTGSGCGCCEGDLPHNHAGFTAVHLKADDGYQADVEPEDVRLPAGACSWYYNDYTTWWNTTHAAAYV